MIADWRLSVSYTDTDELEPKISVCEGESSESCQDYIRHIADLNAALAAPSEESEEQPTETGDQT